MNVIGINVIILFIKQHTDSRPWLNSFLAEARQASWKNIVGVRLMYPHADAVGSCTVFNIKGNKYRLITKIDYPTGTVQIKRVLTHAEYDKEKWKKDCGG